jgi:hypothetical protein
MTPDDASKMYRRFPPTTVGASPNMNQITEQNKEVTIIMKNGLAIGFVSVAMVGAAAFSPVFAADPAPNATDKGAPAIQSPTLGDMGGSMQSPGAVQGQKLSAVEITNVDKAKGTVEIKKKEGGQETFKLDDGAKAQLDKIQKGDKVDIEVVDRNGEKIATSLTKSS